MVTEEQVVAPTAADDEEPIETPESDDGDAGEAKPSLADLINEETATQVLDHPAVRSLIQTEIQRAEDRTRNKVAAEARRRYGDPATVTAAAHSILMESGLESELSRSQSDRLNNLIATFEEQAALKIAGEIPRVFFSQYKLPQNTLDEYTEKIGASDPDGAFQALVDGAVAAREAAIKADFDKRVESEVAKRVKAELNASTAPGAPNIPGGTRGRAASRSEIALTTAEVEALPYAVWRRLPDDVKTKIKGSVNDADRSRGRETVDQSVVERISAMAQ